MADHTDLPRQGRFDELLAAEALGHLSIDEAAELDAFAEEGLADRDRYESLQAEAAVAFDAASGERDELPASMRDRVIGAGRSAVAGEPLGPVRRTSVWPVALAALLAIGSLATIVVLQSQHAGQLESTQLQLAAMRERAEANDALLADARESLAERSLEIDSLTERAASQEQRLAAALARSTELAQQLADATSSLTEAELRIAQLIEPIDPAEVRENRRKLLDVPGTVRLAWSPFDLPDAPAEQPGVQGDVVWNDELEQGYLRFVGLKPNDPEVEQYQVWVIDERGMEQKVSGGVFNADADGEIIVPIDPAIDVGRVALFAITVEDPGGTWVPDLSRRVVIAPRG